MDASPLSETDVEFLELAALNRPSASMHQLKVEAARRLQLNSVVTSAIELAIFASRSAQFKASMGSVFQEILAKVELQSP